MSLRIRIESWNNWRVGLDAETVDEVFPFLFEVFIQFFHVEKIVRGRFLEVLIEPGNELQVLLWGVLNEESLWLAECEQLLGEQLFEE